MESKAVEYQDNSIEKVITNKDLNTMAWKSMFLQASFNYERMQACGLLYSLLPGLKKIHKNKKDLSMAMQDHMEFFNTHPFLVTFIMGIVIAMEENKSDRNAIRSIKVATMGPLGGIGDALFWLTLLPICVGIGASFGKQGSILGAAIFLGLFNVVHLALRFGLMRYGYNQGVKAISNLKEGTKKISRAASILGITVLGALVASYIKLSTVYVATIGEAKVAFQKDVLDKVLLNMLPLLYALLMYKLVKKGFSTIKLVIITIVIGVAGKAIGIL